MQPLFRSAAELVAQCLRDDPTFGLMTPAEQRAEARMLMTKVEGCDPDDIDVQMEALTLAAQPIEASTSSRVVDLGRRRIVVAAPRVASAPQAQEVAKPTIARPVVDVAPQAPPTASVRAFEPQICRNQGGCTERLGATGRCMDCGAQRQAPPTPNVARIDSPDPVHNTRIVSAKKQGKKQVKMRKDASLDPPRRKRLEGSPEGYARKRGEMLRGGVLERVKGLTNAPDHYLGRLIGRTRPTVQAYLRGRIDLNMNAWQIGQLKTLLEQQRLSLDDTIDELDALLAVTPRMEA